MIARYIAEFTEGTRVSGAFLLRSRETRVARNGDAYLAIEISDRTGAIPGVMFRPSPEAASVPAGGVVDIQGVVTSYRGEKRVSVNGLRPASSWEPGDLMGTSRRPLDEMKSEFGAMVKSISHPAIRATLRFVFGNSGLWEKFCSAPASQGHHHACMGGLLEHTLAVASMCEDAAARYEGIDRDLLLAAALLHDVGKTEELRCDSGIGYTDAGRFIGHVVSGAMIVRAAATRANLDSSLALRLEHAILSHHGELEWGSPKRPATAEALVLHHLDNLDAKASALTKILRGASAAEECWTDASNLFRRPLYAPRAAEDDRPSRPSEDDQYLRLTA